MCLNRRGFLSSCVDARSPDQQTLRCALGHLSAPLRGACIHFATAQVPASLRNMIGRSFATEDAHDKIRAYVIELFEVIECEAEANLEQVGAARRNEVRVPEPLCENSSVPARGSIDRNCFFAFGSSCWRPRDHFVAGGKLKSRRLFDETRRSTGLP